MSKFKKFKDNISPAELDETFAKKTAKKESKVFNPGEHEVKIASADEKGANRRDSDWLDYELTLEGVGGKSTRIWLPVPTTSRVSETLDGQYYMSTFKRLVRFCEALGIEGTHTNPEATLERFFENPARLVGLHLKIKVAFKGYHAQFTKTEQGSQYQLVDKENNLVTEEVFPNRDALEAYIKQNQLEKAYKPFPEVVGYYPSATKNVLSAITNVKKIATKTSILGLD